MQALQAPFRSGIEIEDYQLDPVVRAIQMLRADLLIADDVGLGRDMVRMAESGFGGLANRTTCWKPILAAVNGYVTTLSTEVNQASFPTPLMALPLRATSRALGTAHARGLNLSAFAKPGSTDPVANFLDAHYSAARCQIDTSRSGLDSFARAALQECL